MKIALVLGTRPEIVKMAPVVREMGRKKLEKMGREAYMASKKKLYVPPPPLIFE